MQADGRKQDSERCFAATMRCWEDPLLVCALQTAGENDNSEIGYVNEEKDHAITHGLASKSLLIRQIRERKAAWFRGRGRKM